MKVYLATSIRGSGSDLDLAREVIHHLKEHGYEVINEGVYSSDSPDENSDDSFVFERDIGMLDKVEVLIADVTYPSLGVGYEICEALRKGKRVIAFYRRGTRVSKLILGNPNVEPVEFSSRRELLNALLSYLEG